MSLRDFMRDRITLEQATHTDDSAFGAITVWAGVRSLACRATQLSAHRMLSYGRTADAIGMRFCCENEIPRTQTHSTVIGLLQVADKAQFRVDYRGRKFLIMGANKPTHGEDSSAFGSFVHLDCEEVPQRVGFETVATS